MKNHSLTPSNRSASRAPLEEAMISLDEQPQVQTGVMGTGFFASSEEKKARLLVRAEDLKQQVKLNVLARVLQGDQEILLLSLRHSDFLSRFGALLLEKNADVVTNVFDTMDDCVDRIVSRQWPEERKAECIRQLEDETATLIKSLKNSTDMLRRAVEETGQRVLGHSR